MAVTFNNYYPAGVMPVYSHASVVVMQTDVDIPTKYNYRYVLDISYLQAGEVDPVVVGRFYASPNKFGYGIFDMSEVLNFFTADYRASIQDAGAEYMFAKTGYTFWATEYQKSIWVGDQFTRLWRLMSNHNCTQIKFISGEIYAEELGGELVYYEGQINQVLATPQVVQDSEFDWYNNWTQEARGYTQNLNSRFMEGSLNYVDTGDPFIGGIVNNNVAATDRFILSGIGSIVLNGMALQYQLLNGSTLLGSDLIELMPTGYDPSGYCQGLHIKCGPKDITELLDGIVAVPDEATEWTHYNLRLIYESAPYSSIYRFNKKCYPRPYERFQMMYKNSYGGWDFQGLHMKSKKNDVVKHNRYRKSIEDWNHSYPMNDGSIRSGFAVDTVRHMSSDFNVEGETTMVLASDWITEQEAEQFRWHILNCNPYILIQPKHPHQQLQIPVIIEDTGYELPKRINGLIQVNVSVKFSQTTRTSW